MRTKDKNVNRSLLVPYSPENLYTTYSKEDLLNIYNGNS